MNIVNILLWRQRKMPSNAQSVHQSMVSLEEPRSLVQQLVTKFYPENDVSTITNIDRSHSKVQQARLKELSESHEQLQSIHQLTKIFLSSLCSLD